MEGAERFRRGPGRGRGAGAARGRGGRGGAGGPAAGQRGIGLAPGERLTAVSAVALVLLMLLDWFGGRNAWQLRLIDVVLVAIALFAVALAIAGATGTERGRLEPAGLALTITGAVAVGIMLTLVLESSGGTVPLVLSLLAAFGILGGGLMGLGVAGEGRLTGRPSPDARIEPRS